MPPAKPRVTAEATPEQVGGLGLGAASLGAISAPGLLEAPPGCSPCPKANSLATQPAFSRHRRPPRWRC